MSWPVVVGSLLVLLALRDIFRTLWHPRGLGTVAHVVFTVVWRGVRVANRVTGRSSELAGPVGLLLSVLAWTGLVVAGWALVYLPSLPDGFVLSPGVGAATESHLLASVYLSLVAVATLGLGDIAPATPWLRLAVPLQALVGFVLLTAAISWILQLYPALTRRRGLARRLHALATTDADRVVAEGEVSVACQLLDGLTEAVTAAHADLAQYPESYYFRESSARSSLAATLPAALALREAGRGAEAAEVRRAAAALEVALADLAHTLGRVFLDRGGSTAAVLEAFATDHQHEA